MSEIVSEVPLALKLAGPSGRPRGVGVIAVVHWVVGTGILVLALSGLALGFLDVFPALFLGLTAGLVGLAGYGLWTLKAWAWWFVFGNASVEALFSLVLLVQSTSALIVLIALTALTAYLWSRPIRSAFAGHRVTARERPSGAVLGAGLVLLALATAWGLSATLDSETEGVLEGSWLLYDGVGSETIVFDAEGAVAAKPASMFASGKGEVKDHTLTINVKGLEGPSGETYSTTFTGTLLSEEEMVKYLPPGLDPAQVDSVYFGRFERTDSPGFAMPVAAIKLREGPP